MPKSKCELFEKLMKQVWMCERITRPVQRSSVTQKSKANIFEIEPKCRFGSFSKSSSKSRCILKRSPKRILISYQKSTGADMTNNLNNNFEKKMNLYIASQSYKSWKVDKTRRKQTNKNVFRRRKKYWKKYVIFAENSMKRLTSNVVKCCHVKHCSNHHGKRNKWIFSTTTVYDWCIFSIES